MPFSSVEIIYNPKSTGTSYDSAKELKTGLAEQLPTLKVRLHSTKYAGHAEKLAYKIAKRSKKPLIISSSGDGGYNEVINGAMKAQLEGASPVCAVLAAGNANDHGRTLTQSSLIELIGKNQLHKIDLLKITTQKGSHKDERFAHSYIGFGLTPIVATELNKIDLNALKEMWIVIKTFYKYRPFKIRHDGHMLNLDSMVFANIGEMAKVLTLSKNSKPDDGFFEVVTFKHGRKLRLLSKLTKATVTGLEPRNKYKSYEFQTMKKIPAQLDGEVKTIQKESIVQITSEHKILTTLVG